MRVGTVIGCCVFTDRFVIPTFGHLTKNNEVVDVVTQIFVPKQTAVIRDGEASLENNGFLLVPVIKYDEDSVEKLRKKLHEYVNFVCDNLEKTMDVK